MMLFTLSAPTEDWLTPCENSVTTRRVRAEQREEPLDLRSIQAADLRRRGDVGAGGLRNPQRIVHARGVGAHDTRVSA